MKQGRPLFRRYLKIHFMFIFFPPMVLIILSAFVEVSVNEVTLNTLNQFYAALFVFGFIIVAFVLISWLFFLKLRKRLTSLQEAMAFSAEHSSFPQPVPVQSDRMDEIDQLGRSFNWMIQQLEDSRAREHEEEGLRHRLIANLSHDLRTPLTILRGHITRLNREAISSEGQSSLAEMDRTITRAGELMDDLFSYTQLTSGKLPFVPAPADIGRLVRAAVAAWYPVFEEQDIQINADIPADTTFYWEADPKWLTRVLDNLFQNIVRHAADGKYVSVMIDIEKEVITVADKGPGMDNSSAYEHGAGIGLSAVGYMLEKMRLKAEFTSDEYGTSVTIGKALPKSNQELNGRIPGM
ncbi:HAMP domain-containing sensor histidine kinase [Paenibacillus sp. FSL R7-0273]|uniref:sensor histidine kinase n=1 Tax=Paenibacillus sp. FSL R7-0273 TaxID=1536772 RepID=UPI00063F7E77|nr:HAMP domain-containing sensor histidine kinase [Paenibacillus sp. FSL R7-0273]OMF97575.1 two-component sensor histidine kinase [Paenibacillus sp. FSL R7-0273]